jgi:hypothetical protein
MKERREEKKCGEQRAESREQRADSKEERREYRFGALACAALCVCHHEVPSRALLVWVCLVLWCCYTDARLLFHCFDTVVSLY